MKKILFFILWCIIGISCSQSNPNIDNKVIPKANSQGLQILPTLPQENIDGLLKNTDYIDIIFQAYSKSINLNNKNAIQANIRFISNFPQPEINCATPFCKVIYYKNAKKLLEGDIHYGNGCAYFVFPNAEGKPEFANKISTSGIAFFNDIINKFNTTTNQ